MDDDEPDEITAELDALMHSDAPGGPDGCMVRPPLPWQLRRRRRRLTVEELTAKYPLYRGSDYISYRDRIEAERLTAYGITLKPRSRSIYRACRTFLALRTREAFNDLFEAFNGSIDAQDEELLEAATDILLIAQGRKNVSVTVITPMVDPLCHRLCFGVKCTERAKIKATVLCKVCGQVRTRLCMGHFNDLMLFLPDSEAWCANPIPGLHQIVALVEGVREPT
jgi:hypothetical protein